MKFLRHLLLGAFLFLISGKNKKSEVDLYVKIEFCAN